MNLCVADVMQNSVVSLSLEARVPEIERVFSESGVSGCPVVDGDGRVCGILSRGDIIRRLCVEHVQAEVISDYYRDPGGVGIYMADGQSFEAIAASAGVTTDRLRAGQLMSSEVVSVAPRAPLAEAARMMVERGFHRLPVIEDGRLLGVISTFDVTREVARGAFA
ncbi:MAG: CBS domain-containing protein [Gammaproteobacteria bacterium]|uniref:CBS domain-containing protein n=1 Tax=Oceanibaculum nanhaiense TaxID=1909734 RepID=UPI0032EBA10C